MTAHTAPFAWLAAVGAAAPDRRRRSERVQRLSRALHAALGPTVLVRESAVPLRRGSGGRLTGHAVGVLEPGETAGIRFMLGADAWDVVITSSTTCQPPTGSTSKLT